MTASASSHPARGDMSRNKVNLDLMRSFAILLVILDHILLSQKITMVGRWQPAWIGVVGVYFFFVHTCLVLMWSLERKSHTLDFYIRRAFRIYPLVLVAIAATVLFHAPIDGTPTNYFHYSQPNTLDLIATSLLIQNIFRHHNLNGVLWSLPLEIDMYIALPALYFFVRRNFSLWPLLLMWLLAYGTAKPFTASSGNIFITCIPCFLPGVMAYVLFRRVKPRVPAWLFPVFLGVLCELFMLHPSVSASWPMCLALGLGLPFFRQISFTPLVKICHQIAKYSYGMYLGHPFAIALGFYILAGHPLWLQLSVTIIVTLVVSVAAYHLLEKPMINLGAKLAAHAERRYEQKHLDAFL